MTICKKSSLLAAMVDGYLMRLKQLVQFDILAVHLTNGLLLATQLGLPLWRLTFQNIRCCAVKPFELDVLSIFQMEEHLNGLQ